jgi:hypothetical protein
MIQKDLLIHKARLLLNELLAPMLQEVDKPRRRFLQQVTRGILFSGSLVVMAWCHWIRDDKLVMGYWYLEAYEMWFSLPAHFVVRQRGDRTYTLDEVPLSPP